MLKFRWETEFKKTEIGEIPKDWEVKQVRDLVDKNEKFPIVDGPFGTQLHMDEYTTFGVPVVRVINLTFDGNFIDDDFVFISEEKFNQLKRSEVKPDDLIVAKTGATIGKLALLPKHIPKALIASSCLKVTFDKSKAHPKYYLKFFTHPLAQESIKTRGEGGSTRDTINLTPFSEIPVPYPPLSEQSRIATVLSWFDDLIENKKRQNEILEKTAMAIFKNWFVDFEPFKDGEFVDSELGKIPKGWEVKAIGEVVTIMRGISFNSDEASFEYFENAIPILRANNIKPNKTIDFTDLMFIPKSKIPEEKKLKELDLVMVGSNGNPELVGNFAFFIKSLLSVDYSFGSFMYCIRADEKIFPFIFCILNSNYFNEYLATVVTGTNISNLKKSDLENFRIPFPHLPILQKFHSLVEPLFQKIINNQKQIMTLRKIRDTLLPLLVFGKLRVEEI